MLRTAVIGLGRIGWNFHMPHIKDHPDFEICAVVDTSEERLQEAKDVYAAAGYTDYKEMLAQEKPDLVVICSPTHLHKLHAIAALEAGCDVFLDKPMATNLQEARDIAQAAKDTGRKLMVFQPHRVTREANAALHILQSGLLGQICQIKRANSGYNRRSDWQSLRKYGGGMLNNYGAHYVDQLLFLTGADVTEIKCWRDCVATIGDADDVVKIIMKTDSGMLLDLDINQACALPLTPMVIQGKYGAAVLNGEKFTVRYVVPEELPPLEVSDELIAKDRKYNLDQPLNWHTADYPLSDFEAGNFYDACAAYFIRGEEPLVPVEQTLRVMELLDECHRQTPEYDD
ncbi:MAG: Gfo/Idh/MocA family oxidoreductase [Ruminococcaceae bacterium]|nr:Gfo/Idh/MocA family oxidoreductase [Oscillospiraceae bacterium]